MSFFDKIKDVTYVNGPEQFLHRGSNEIFVAKIVKISTFNKDVLDSEWSLTSCALRLVCTPITDKNVCIVYDQSCNVK